MEISLKELNKPGLFEKFRQQVHKDYELSGCLDFTPVILSDNLEELQTAIANSLSELNGKQNAAYYSLLYRVDISELQIRQAIDAQPDKYLFLVIAKLVIKRELQKVILKHLYSANEPDN